MNINFELYRIFYTVAGCGNITKASKELMISQPAVTKQLKTLENQLGGELFDVNVVPKFHEKKFGIVLPKDSMHSFGTNQLIKHLQKNKD